MTLIYNDRLSNVYVSPIICNLGDLAHFFGSQTETLVNGAQRRFKAQHRIWEWLTIRAMLFEAIGCPTEICYTSQGHPFLKGSDLNISISHTKTQAALLLSQHQNVGVDIEHISPRILNLQHRIAQPEELPEDFGLLDQDARAKHLTSLWTIKEAIYKSLTHQEGVDLLAQITQKPHCNGIALFDGKEISVQTLCLDENILSFTAY